MYINNGIGVFSKAVNSPLARDFGATNGSTWGDLDNDGDMDVIFTNFYEDTNQVFYNDGFGGMLPVLMPFSVDSLQTTGAFLLDFNLDGFLDVFITHYDGNDQLFMGEEGSTFTAVSAGPLTANNTNSMSAAISDINNDGYQDIYVCCGYQTGFVNHLYLGGAGGTFTEVTSGPAVTDVSQSIGASWGDFNNDGLMDLFVINRNGNAKLYENNGNASFGNVTSFSSASSNSRSCSWADIDNDGDLDLYQGNVPSGNSLYINNGGSLSSISLNPITTDQGESKGVAFGDADNDGDLDLFVANDYSQLNYLYLNDGNTNNFLKVSCQGSPSNRSGIGARIEIVHNASITPLYQYRDISSRTGPKGANGLIAHFGLGLSPLVDTLRIYWPSGLVQTLSNIGVNQHLLIIEGQGYITVGGTEEFLPSSGPLVFPNPADNVLNISAAESSLIQIFDFGGRMIRETSNTSSIDISGFTPGIYFIKVLDKEGRQISRQKFIKI